VEPVGVAAIHAAPTKGIASVKLTRLLSLAALLLVISMPAVAQVNDTYVIPVAANARGAFGTHWMTRFSVFNPHLDYTLRLSVTFIPSGGAPGIEELVDLPANSLAYSDNLLFDLFGVNSGSGSLLVAAFAEDNPGVPDDILARAFLVNSDTFNNRQDGTYGQTIAGVWAGLMDYDSDGISSVAHGIRNNNRFRTNVGAVNLGRCSATLYVTAYDADGNTVLDGAPFYLPPLGHMQDRLPIAVDRATLEFFVDDPCAADDDRYAIVFPYTSMVDQQTGDPSYQAPTLLASPGILYAKGQKVEPTAIGKKIDSEYAARVRATARRGTGAKLVRTEQGLQITK
jgi:hypothetical protein